MARSAAKRTVMTIRITPALVRRIDALVERKRRQLDSTWSRNNEVVALLADAVTRAEELNRE